ncbi:MAG: sigma factor [Lysobacterales bacterium]
MHRFRTTRWSLIIDARCEAGEAARALETLCKIYRPPVFGYIRRRVASETEAEDLTQAFFEQLLRLKSYAGADPARGRFRVYLQVGVRRFLARQAEAAHAAKRGGGTLTVELDDHLDDGGAMQSRETPDSAFERDFANALVDEALRDIEDEAVAAGKLELFRELRPFLFESPDRDEYASLAARLGLRRNTLAVAIHRLRNRLREKVRTELAETVAQPADFDRELAILQSSLAESGLNAVDLASDREAVAGVLGTSGP